MIRVNILAEGSSFLGIIVIFIFVKINLVRKYSANGKVQSLGLRPRTRGPGTFWNGIIFVLFLFYGFFANLFVEF
jgi:hypothetical protein